MKAYYAPGLPLPPVKNNLIPAELQAEADKLINENQPGFTNKLMKLMKSHRMKQPNIKVA